MSDQVNAGGEGADVAPAGPGDGTPRKMSRKMVGWIVVLVVTALCLGAVVSTLSRARDEARKVRCSNTLVALAKGMNMYLLKFGDNSTYPVPANAFRGTDWFAVEYWKEICTEPRVFHCPAKDTMQLLAPKTREELQGYAWDGSDSKNCVEYAARKQGPGGTATETTKWTESDLPSSTPMACDMDGNHPDGINVVYFDSHVEFLPDAGRYIGNTRGVTTGEKELEFMDDGQ